MTKQTARDSTGNRPPGGSSVDEAADKADRKAEKARAVVTRSYDLYTIIDNVQSALNTVLETKPSMEWAMELGHVSGPTLKVTGKFDNTSTFVAGSLISTDWFSDKPYPGEAGTAKSEWETVFKALSIHESASKNRNQELNEKKYEAYDKFNVDVKAWVDTFNAFWERKGTRLHARADRQTRWTRWDMRPPRLGVWAISVGVIEATPPAAGGKRPRPPEAEQCYEFYVNFFEHTVTVNSFFWLTPPATRALARELVATYERLNGKTRTCLGMLSSWTDELSKIGTEHITWWGETTPMPRVTVLVDVWQSVNGKHTSADFKNPTDPRAFGDALERKAKLHGVDLNKPRAARIQQIGYYGLMSAGKLLKHEPHKYGDPREIAFRATVVSDACV